MLLIKLEWGCQTNPRCAAPTIVKLILNSCACASTYIDSIRHPIVSFEHRARGAASLAEPVRHTANNVTASNSRWHESRHLAVVHAEFPCKTLKSLIHQDIQLANQIFMKLSAVLIQIRIDSGQAGYNFYVFHLLQNVFLGIKALLSLYDA